MMGQDVWDDVLLLETPCPSVGSLVRYVFLRPSNATAVFLKHGQ